MFNAIRRHFADLAHMGFLAVVRLGGSDQVTLALGGRLSGRWEAFVMPFIPWLRLQTSEIGFRGCKA